MQLSKRTNVQENRTEELEQEETSMVAQETEAQDAVQVPLQVHPTRTHGGGGMDAIAGAGYHLALRRHAIAESRHVT